MGIFIYIYRPERIDGRNSHVLIYHGPLTNRHLLGVAIAIYFH